MRKRNNIVSQAETAAINQQFYGRDEPALDKHLADHLNWYQAMCDDDTAIQFLKEFLEDRKRFNEIEKLKLIPKDWVPHTAAWLARLFVRGYSLSVHNMGSINAGLEKALSHVSDEQNIPDEEKYIPNVQQRTRDKASDFVGEVEGMIDDGTLNSLYNHLQKNEASAPIVRRLIERLEPHVEELKLAASGVDEELNEAYRLFVPNAKGTLKQVAKQFEDWFADAKRYAQNLKATKPRKKKSPSLDKVVSKFKYAKTNDEYKLTSIDPRKIINASEVWTFNTKYFTLSVFRGNGLGIKGTTITNYDQAQSFSTRIGRKTSETLRTVLDGGKVALRKLAMKHPPKTGRTSDDTIILRVA